MTTPHQQACPIAASLNQLGDAWTLLIVREASRGVSRFSDFRKNTGIAKNLLAQRLRGGSVYLNSLARFISGLRIAVMPLREAAGGCIADRVFACQGWNAA
jgi:HxlR-like helix-turn-helix